MKKAELRLELDDYLVNWLKEFLREIGMSLHDFIGSILYRYYEAWRIGRDSAYRLKEEAELSLESLIDEFLKTYAENKRLVKHKWLIKHFSLWLKENKLGASDVDKGSIEKFLKDYSSQRNVKKTSLYPYKYILEKFASFVKEKLRS